MISANLSAIFYLVSGILFILALRGLSHPESARLGNIFGILGMIIAVGTTTTRLLENSTQESGQILEPGSGLARNFILPGYKFKVVDGIITNFHLPKSTLLMMVSAMAGKENILSAYKNAIENNYRFYSFGDSMLII